MVTEAFVRAIPKVELHVHLEGSIRPETVLKLSKRHNIDLPAHDLEGLRQWYVFRDFPHFMEVYVAVSSAIRTPEDVELIAREFLEGQAEQNVLHSEVTYTASTIERFAGIPWNEQKDALRRALEYGERALGVSARFILDIVRGDPAERGRQVAAWAIDGHRDGIVCALGLAGLEKAVPAAQYADAYAMAGEAGLPFIPHAGETSGAASLREVLVVARPVRIGHGVRCLEDPAVVAELRDRQIPLEVCPTSNVRLGVFPSLERHALPRLLDEGLYVTINSDDPPLFNTTITDELLRSARTFGLSEDILLTLTLNAGRASLLPDDRKRALLDRLREGFGGELLHAEGA
jgi:adenosine deaminase